VVSLKIVVIVPKVKPLASIAASAAVFVIPTMFGTVHSAHGPKVTVGFSSGSSITTPPLAVLAPIVMVAVELLIVNVNSVPLLAGLVMPVYSEPISTVTALVPSPGLVTPGKLVALQTQSP
jgi:hypothetical protein